MALLCSVPRPAGQHGAVLAGNWDAPLWEMLPISVFPSAVQLLLDAVMALVRWKMLLIGSRAQKFVVLVKGTVPGISRSGCKT